MFQLFQYGGTNYNIPGLIECEFFDLGGEGVAYHDNATKQGNLTFRPTEMVDFILRSGIASNNYVLSYGLINEWTQYTVNVTPGTYAIVFKYFCSNPIHGNLKVSLDGIELCTITGIINQASMSVQGTVTIPNIAVAGGTNKILKLEYVNGAAFDLDAIEFKSTIQNVKSSNDVLISNNNRIFCYNSKAFSIFPNPVSTALNISFPTNDNLREIKLYNTCGQLIFNTITKDKNLSLDLKSLNLKGMVIIQIQSDGVITNNKVIIK